jgi:hypothetical protein
MCHTCFFYSLGEISLIRLRNPWGKNEWKGAWSDTSKEWEYLPDDLKNNKIDGEFFIALDDFLRVSNRTIIVIVKLIRYYPAF